jgi:hypothetical protein
LHINNVVAWASLYVLYTCTILYAAHYRYRVNEKRPSITRSLTHSLQSNTSLYTVIDRAITKTKGQEVQEYVFCSMVFVNIYVQGRGKGGVHL